MTKQIVGLAALTAASAFAQGGYRNDPYYNGGNYGSGKCTVEVEIDQATDVLVTGGNVQLRNLAGGRPSLVRTNCNSPMPLVPRRFRFRGIDGRGRQTLVADPGSTGGTAVVRLEDPDWGRHRYTFDLTWSGGNGSYNSGAYGNGEYGYPNNGGYTNNGYPVYRDDRNPRRDRNRNRRRW